MMQKPIVRFLMTDEEKDYVTQRRFEKNGKKMIAIKFKIPFFERRKLKVSNSEAEIIVPIDRYREISAEKFNGKPNRTVHQVLADPDGKYDEDADFILTKLNKKIDDLEKKVSKDVPHSETEIYDRIFKLSKLLKDIKHEKTVLKKPPEKKGTSVDINMHSMAKYVPGSDEDDNRDDKKK